MRLRVLTSIGLRSMLGGGGGCDEAEGTHQYRPEIDVEGGGCNEAEGTHQYRPEIDVEG